MAAGSRYPLDAHGKPISLKDGTSPLLACPPPGPLREHSSYPPHFTKSVLVFDSGKLHRLFHSAAMSIALARDIAVTPMSTNANDPWGVRFFAAIMPNRWQSQEVDVPGFKQLEKEANDGANEFGDLFWNELDQRGARGAITFLVDVQAQRENAIAKVKQVYASVASHNQGAVEAQQNIYHFLVGVKCTATIIVAGLSLPVVPGLAAAAGWASAGTATGAVAFGTGFTYSVSLELVKEWSKADAADVVLATTKKTVTEGGKEGGKEAAKHMEEYFEEASHLGKEGEKFLAGKHWLQKRILAGGTAKQMARYARKLRDVKAGVKAAQNAGRISQALKTVPYLLFAWASIDALQEAHEEW